MQKRIVWARPKQRRTRRAEQIARDAVMASLVAANLRNYDRWLEYYETECGSKPLPWSDAPGSIRETEHNLLPYGSRRTSKNGAVGGWKR